MPKFLVDESAGKGVAGELKRLGFDAVYVGDIMRGAKDRDVLKRAYGENRVLITNDKDFGELVFKQKIKSKGVILLRLDDERTTIKKEYIGKLLDNFLNKIENRFVVVTEDSIRIRKL